MINPSVSDFLKQVKIDKPSNATVDTSHKPISKKIVILISLLISLVVISTSGVIIVPKVYTYQFVRTIRPDLNSLKTATHEVRIAIEDIHALTTSQDDPTRQNGLKTAGLIIHPDIAYLSVSDNVLGVTANAPSGLVEKSVVSIQEQLKGSLVFPGKRVAGTNTNKEENESIKQLRLIKDETTKAQENTRKANSNINFINSEATISAILLSQDVKQNFIDDASINNNIKPFIEEASKVADYYDTLSEALIAMNSKITAYKASLSSAATTFSQTSNPILKSDDLRLLLNQSQVYLNQAKTDAKDLKGLAQNLQNISNTDLPQKSEEYHQHNLKVLHTVNTYFDSESGIMQTYIDSSKLLLDKIDSNSLTNKDVNNYLSIINKGRNNATIADTKFSAEIQSLTGEEATLTITFWQNNSILIKGDKAEKSIDHLINSISGY